MVDVVVVVSLEMEVDMAMWSCDAFLVFVAGECALGDRLRKEVSFRRLLKENRCSSDQIHELKMGHCEQIKIVLLLWNFMEGVG